MNEKVDILFVDDVEILRTLATEIFNNWGYFNKVVRDGQSALDFLAEVSLEGKLPRLVITDNDMPRVTGIELIKKARELYPGLPFIIVTGVLENHQEYFKKENIPYLGKPYSLVDFKTKIEENILP